MKKFKLYLTILSTSLCLTGYAKEYTVVSPNGDLKAVVSDNLTYKVLFNGATAVDGTAALTLDNGKTLTTMKSARSGRVHSEVASPFYRSTSIPDNYNWLTLKSDKDWSVEFRAYDDGIAYRWVYNSKKPVNVIDETVDFDFSPGASAWIPYTRGGKDGEIETQFFNSFENLYTEGKLSELPTGRLAFLPVVIAPSDNLKVLITESDIADYPGLFLRPDGNSLKGIHAPKPKKWHTGGHINIQKIIDETHPYIATISGARNLPWRIVAVTDNDKDLAATQLTYLLGAPSQISDISWIKPGKVAWDWWNDWNLIGVDFPVGINQKTYEAYIDFAAKNGIEYVILDEGWSVRDCGNLFDVIPEIDMPALVKYASDKGVGIILWGGFVPFMQDLEEVCRHYAEMGVKGFKIDFFDSNDQDETGFLDKAAETAARYNLVLDLHGTHIPAGINRKWPNVLNCEGVHGLETNKWNDRSYDQMHYDVTIPFIRQAGGPMDYTQGAMHNANRNNFYPIYSNPMSQGTRCHQLGLYPILDSPLNMLCDSPSNYNAEPESLEFIAGIPTVWDETIIVDGRLGEYIVTARRKGNDWYIGGITDWTPRDITVDLSFLPEGQYDAVWFIDGVNAHRNAQDYKRIAEPMTAGSGTVKNIHLAPGGGFAAHLTKK